MMSKSPSVSIQDQLRPGKRVLWEGWPQGSLLTQRDAALIHFGLVWLTLLSFAEISALTHGVILAALWGVPFFAFGVYLAGGRLLVKARRRQSGRVLFGWWETSIRRAHSAREIFLEASGMCNGG